MSDKDKEFIGILDDKKFNAILIDRLYFLASCGDYAGEFWTIRSLMHWRSGKGLIDFDMSLHLSTLHKEYGTAAMEKNENEKE